MDKSLRDSYRPTAPNYYSGRGEIVATRANLPHWNKQITASFVTFRLADSLPAEKLNTLQAARERWLEQHPRPWTNDIMVEYFTLFDDNIQKWLDSGYGSCVLKEPENREIVEDVLWHFAGERYQLYAYVVMANHVHVLFQPQGEWSMSEIVTSWKRFSAKRINERRGTSGEALWQKESFDTLVRNERHFQTIVRYIKKNDLKLSWSCV